MATPDRLGSFFVTLFDFCTSIVRLFTHLSLVEKLLTYAAFLVQVVVPDHGNINAVPLREHKNEDRGLTAETESNSTQQETGQRERSLTTLAEMLSKQRQLWRSTEPYLDQWEAMLSAEGRTQARLQSQNDESTRQSTSGTTELQPNAGVNHSVTTAAVESRSQHIGDSNNQEPISTWNQTVSTQLYNFP